MIIKTIMKVVYNMDNTLFYTIIKNRDVSGYFALDDSTKEDFLITLMYDFLSEKDLLDMNNVQKTLFLAMKLEDTCQADSLPSLSDEEDIFLSLSDIVTACEELGAIKTAHCVKEFISILPDNEIPEWDWFFDKERREIIERIDGEISDYPDGLMKDLYIKYLSDLDRVSRLFDNLS